MYNITFRCPENLLPLLIIIAILAILLIVFAKLHAAGCDKLIYYSNLPEFAYNIMVRIHNSTVNSESHCLYYFNTMLPLDKVAGLLSKDRIMILTLNYQIPGKIINNQLSVKESYKRPVVYDYTQVPPSHSNLANTLKFNQGLTHLSPWINKVIAMDSFSTYTNHDYGFTLRYPSNWGFEEINRLTSDHNLLVAKFFPDSTAKNLVNVSIFVDESVINKNLSGYVNERIDKFKTSSAFDSISRSTESSHLAAHPAYKLSFSERGPENLRLNSTEVGTIVGGKGFIIRTMANDNQYSLYQKNIELIMNSFRLLGHPL